VPHAGKLVPQESADDEVPDNAAAYPRSRPLPSPIHARNGYSKGDTPCRMANRMRLAKSSIPSFCIILAR
jgi:hypothetical protein